MTYKSEFEDEFFDTILSSDVDFSGTLSFEEPFLIRGKLSGEIIANGLLFVDTEGVVIADISAPEVIVRGFVNGNIKASERIDLASGGKIMGDIKSSLVSMESGCVFNGLCTMDNSADKK